MELEVELVSSGTRGRLVARSDHDDEIDFFAMHMTLSAHFDSIVLETRETTAGGREQPHIVIELGWVQVASIAIDDSGAAPTEFSTAHQAEDLGLNRETP